MTWVVALLAALVSSSAGAAYAQHAGDLLVGSTAAGGGALGVAFDFGRRVVVSESVLPGLFTTTDPGFDVLQAADPATGLHPLAGGTHVTLELLAADAGASIKIGATVLDAPGEVAAFPMPHTHPEWRLVHGGGGVVDAIVRFRLTADAYGPSPPYALVVTNALDTPTTSTTVSSSSSSTTSTSTTPAPPCATAACTVDALVDAVARAAVPPDTGRRLGRHAAAAARSLASSMTAAPRRADRLRRRTVRRLVALRSLVERALHRGRIADPTGDELLARVDAALEATAEARS